MPSRPRVPRQVVIQRIRAEIDKNIRIGEDRVEREENTPLDVAYWKKNENLRKLFSLARNKYISGKPFFGHGNWYSFLREELSISHLGFKHLPDERLCFLIKEELNLGRGIKAGKWNVTEKNPKKLFSALYLYQTARKRGFLGKRSWADFIHWINSPEYDAWFNRKE